MNSIRSLRLPPQVGQPSTTSSMMGEVMVALFVLGLAVGCYGLAVRLLPLERVGASEGEAQVESAYADAGADAVLGAASGASPRDEVSTGKEVRDGGAA